LYDRRHKHLSDGKAAENAAVVGSPALPQDELNKLTDDIVAALKTVYDPEIPADIYELGLIYKIDIGDDGDQDRHVTDIAELPRGPGVADHGRECGVECPGCERDQGGRRVGPALGPQPDVR
jgi:hypothetical protein